MPTKKEGVHKVSRESRRRAGEPEQDADRRTENAQRTVLPTEGRMRLDTTTRSDALGRMGGMIFI